MAGRQETFREGFYRGYRSVFKPEPYADASELVYQRAAILAKWDQICGRNDVEAAWWKYMVHGEGLFHSQHG